MKKQELTVTEKTELAAVNLNEWGDVVVESKDLILPKILLQQAMSEAVKQRQAMSGDYFNTLTNEVVSNDKGEVELLPFFCRQSYVIEKWNGKRFEYFRTDTCLPGEAQRPFEEQVGSDRIKNVHCYDFFVLTKDGGVPSIISFRSTSHKAGKQLFNLMYVLNISAKRPPADKWITLSRKEVSNDMGTFWTMDFKPSRQSTPEELKECLNWINTIKTTNFKTAEEPKETVVESSRF